MKTPTVISNMSAKTEKRILWAIAAVLVMAVIFVFSSQASFASEEASDALAELMNMEQQDLQTRVSNQSILFGLTLRKLAHIFLFAALGFCLYQAMADVKRRLVIATGAAYLYGVLDEIHQSLAGRYGRWQDTLIDLIGIALGLAAALLLPKLNVLCKKWFYEDWDTKHPVAKKRLEWCLDALSLAAVMQYVGYRFLQTTMFEFIYSELYKTATFLSLLVFGGVRFVYLFTRKLWADADEKAQIRRFLKFVGVCVLALPFFIVAYLHDYKVLIFIPICWMCLYDIQAELVFKWYVRVIGVMLGATVLCCLAGVVKNLGAFDSGHFREAYGIINRTDFAAYFVFIMLSIWCVMDGEKWYPSLLIAISMLVLGIYTYYLAGSRTTLICCFLSAVVCLYEWFDRVYLGERRWIHTTSKAINAIVIFAFPVMMLLLILATYLHGQNYAWMQRIDTLFSKRISLARQAFSKFGFGLWGRSFTMHGWGASLIGDPNHYDFLDSSYEHLLIRYGLILTLVVMVLWVQLSAKTTGKNKKIALSMAVIAVYAFSESHFMEIDYNILLSMPFCAYEMILNDETNASKFSLSRRSSLSKRLGFTILSLLLFVLCAACLLPKVISWLRTVFYLLQWGSGTQAFFAFLLCLVLLSLTYVMWILVNKIWYTRSKNVCVAIMCGIALLIASAIFINSEIQHGLTKCQDEMDAEANRITLIQASAKKPVYALEKAELYQRYFGGFSEGIMTPEDILRKRNGTIITDKSNELLVVTLWGGKYLQVSESSGIYSFDPAVIDALSSEGFEWKDFYYSERKCDLADIAKLNNVHLNKRGRLVLEGPEHSLSENRFYDQWAGEYQVSYTLGIDDEKLQYSDDSPICTLRIMGYKNEEEILEKKILRSEFNNVGFCRVTISYTIPSTPRVEYLVIAADGVTLYVDEIAWRRVA